jgi:hypothetical protein
MVGNNPEALYRYFYISTENHIEIAYKHSVYASWLDSFAINALDFYLLTGSVCDISLEEALTGQKYYGHVSPKRHTKGY